jgi:hypothetical protein
MAVLLSSIFFSFIYFFWNGIYSQDYRPLYWGRMSLFPGFQFLYHE